MLKYVTPRQLALGAAAIFAIGVTLLHVVIGLLVQETLIWKPILIEGVLVFPLAYFLFFYILKVYIYRKVKLIYKNIHRLKRVGTDKFTSVDMDADIISEIQQEVEDWAAHQQREIDQLKSMEDYRRNFVGNVSHELKTPIFTVQGYIYSLLEGGVHDPKINISFLRKAAKGIQRLQTIVEDLDAISKLESGAISLKLQKFNIKELVEEVFEDLEMIAKERNITLVFKEGADRDFSVEADRENIRQVITNLIINAVKYGNDYGQVKVSFYDMDKNILVEVSDNGIGVEEAHVPHLFDRFYRVNTSGARSEGGSGLGLAIVKHIIDAHKQTINVRSTFGVGSTFGFTLSKSV